LSSFTLGTHWSRVDWVLTDVDDTITLHGRLPPEALRALEQLQEAGIGVVAVTGACAGWCDHIAHAWPVNAVLGENGAFVLEKHNGRMTLTSARPLADIRADQARLRAQIEAMLVHEPDLSLTLDQPYRLCEVAIDIGQNRERVDPERVATWLAKLHALGVHATASSIHINAWYGEHSKRTTALRYLAERGLSKNELHHRVACIGDSPNDQALFEALPLSVGVANIRKYWERLQHRPSVVTDLEGGYGFAQFAQALLRARKACD
jgi:HAD superfamily hydrolase (TIGR01484 family)